MLTEGLRARRRRRAPDNSSMHLLIPFAAGLTEASAHVLGDLALPNLAKLLARLAPAARDEAEADTLSPPHERTLAAAFGWQAGDGTLPFAARAAAADGIEVGRLAWGLVTPCHWVVGRDHVTLAEPAALELGEVESRAAFDAVRPLFEGDGFRLEWAAPTRWYAAHERLAGLPCAALDRVVGRDVEHWLRAGDAAGSALREVRRLQAEWQLLLYPHPLNEAREQRGALTLNSFWLSGCGRFQPELGPAPIVDERLREPLLAQDFAAWADAWRALDADAIGALLEASREGDVALTLCGERAAQRFESAPARGWWRRQRERWRASEPRAVLEAL